MIATTEILKLKNGKYYSAFLDFSTNNVYIGPQVSEEVAMAIVLVNNEQFGIFTFSAKDARSLVGKLGTPVSHSAHGGCGYYKHYHLKQSSGESGNAHIWYFG